MPVRWAFAACELRVRGTGGWQGETMSETILALALTNEANAIHGPGKIPAGLAGKKLYQKLNEQNATALCFSGGGIRSASFCLGVIEALARHPRPQAVESPPASPPALAPRV